MRIVLNISLAIGAIALSVPIAWAQQQEPDQSGQPVQPSQPIPAYHSPLASAANNAQDQTNADSQKLLPDTTALTGIQDLSLGVPASNHSYWQPHLDLSSTVDSNPLTGQRMDKVSRVDNIHVDLWRSRSAPKFRKFDADPELCRRRFIFE